MDALLDWYEKNKRDLPWRKSNNPYYILLSEFILQQTRVNQGLKYYLKFIGRYSTIQDLANADINEIMRMWQGLGYYSRAKNLSATCREIVFDRNGEFPNSYSELKKLKGVGDYTAAAIASIAFNEAVPVIDGNVHRVLSRYYAESNPIITAKGKKIFRELADEILDKKFPGKHNQAIMELGSLVCTPVSPNCQGCPLNNSCQAFIKSSYSCYPVKKEKQKSRNRYFFFYIYKVYGKTIIHQRTGKDIWNGLYQFPLFESEKPIENGIFPLSRLNTPSGKSVDYNITYVSSPIKHILSHQTIYATFIHIETDIKEIIINNNWLLIDIEQLDNYALPRLITRYLEKKGI